MGMDKMSTQFKGDNPDKLRVGVYQPSELPQSFMVYLKNVEQNVPVGQVEFVRFQNRFDLPAQVDVLWDLRSGGGNSPVEFLMEKQPLVVTIHGFAPITLSGWDYFHSFKGVLLSKTYARKKLEAWKFSRDKVAALVTVSNFVKQEIIELIGFSENKITVCHHGASPDSFKVFRKDNHDKYFLHVSNAEPRKNLDRIISAFRRIRKSHKDVRLVLKLPKSAEPYHEDGVDVVFGLLSEVELATLYQGALGFLFPSLYEGFGMPILEAMACGCPVVTSSVSACPEVAGNAALIVDPYSIDKLFEAMEMLYFHAPLRTRLINAGLERVKHFSWKVSAADHVKTFYSASYFGR